MGLAWHGILVPWLCGVGIQGWECQIIQGWGSLGNVRSYTKVDRYSVAKE